MRAALCALDAAVREHAKRCVQLLRPAREDLCRAANGQDRLAELGDVRVRKGRGLGHTVAERGQTVLARLDTECGHRIGREVGRIRERHPACRRQVEHGGQCLGGLCGRIAREREIVQRIRRLRGGERSGLARCCRSIPQQLVAVDTVLDGVLGDAHGRNDLRHAALEALTDLDGIAAERRDRTGRRADSRRDGGHAGLGDAAEAVQSCLETALVDGGIEL